MKSGPFLDGYIKRDGSSNGSGLGIRGGEKPTTSGIDFWGEVFVIPDPQNPRNKMCVLLMDTQGLWDPNTSSRDNGRIFGLSCALSSYVIFNHMGVLQSTDLSQLATQTDFSSGLAKIQSNGKKAFQQLTLLFRDCKDIDKDDSLREIDEIVSEKSESLNTSAGYKDHMKKLRECFEDVNSVYICKPGDIDTQRYDGDLRKVNDMFFILMGRFIEDIFMKIRPRLIGGVNVTGKTFIHYASNFADAFRKKNVYPNPDMIMDAACDISNCEIIDSCCNVCYICM